MHKSRFVLPLLLLSILGWSAKVLAHGAGIDYEQVKAVQIQATYEGGLPMKEAQVTVYAPEDPSTPWTTGTTDKEGRFTFVPDPSQSGNWEVKVRQAGHGDIVSIPVEGTAGSTQNAQLPSDEQYTPLQKVLLGAAGVWGFVGTALFFARRKAD